MGAVMTPRRIGAPTRTSIDDIWHRRATAAAIVAVRELINAGGAIPPATPVSRLSDIELGWFTGANLFAWIKCRSEQATAEGWNTELALRLTGMDPDPWDAGAVETILPELGELQGFDWSKPITSWPKSTMVRFLLEALMLADKAMLVRDVGGGGITTNPNKSKDEMQRIASAEAGGPLMTPEEMNDSIPF
jgi:hypothetical protein